MVQFVIFGLLTTAMLIAVERRNRTMNRLLTAPLRRSEVLAGHLLAMFALTLVQELLLVLAGQFLFGVNYLRSPLAILAVMITLALWVSGFGLLIGSQVRTPEQVALWALVSMFVLSALGGAWFPLDITGRVFASLGHLMPSAWAMDAFQNVLVRGLGLSSVLLPSAVMLAYAVVFLGLAAWRFRPD